MADCELRVPADAENIRLARLVAVAAARRIGMGAEQVEDVRSAVSEAVTRAVVRHMNCGCDAAVDVSMSHSRDRFEVAVRDRVADDADDDSGLSMAVILGLVPEVEVGAAPDGGEILHMAWVL